MLLPVGMDTKKVIIILSRIDGNNGHPLRIFSHINRDGKQEHMIMTVPIMAGNKRVVV
jgi:hypothetical protein